jgi:hypothetical protein
MACTTRKHGHETLERMGLPGPHTTWTSHAPGSPGLPRGVVGGAAAASAATSTVRHIHRCGTHVTDGAISPHPGHEKKNRQAKACSLEKTYRIHSPKS